MKLKYSFALIAALGLASCGPDGWKFPSQLSADQTPDGTLLLGGFTLDDQIEQDGVPRDGQARTDYAPGSDLERITLAAQSSKPGIAFREPIVLSNKSGPSPMRPTVQNEGFTAPLIDSLREGGFSGTPDLEVFADQPSNQNCSEAKAAKIAFLKSLNPGENLPKSFGNISDMDFKVIGKSTDTDNELWVGYIEICSWIQAGDTYNEYFWHIDLEYAGSSDTVQTIANEGGIFPGTLDTSSEEIRDLMAIWKYKLHGKRTAIRVANVWKNGAFLDQNAFPSYYKVDNDCFDLFLDKVGAATNQLDTLRSTGSLNDLAGFCLGRCDGGWMSTH